MGTFAIVLAAGKGTRMKTAKENFPKVCFPLLGKPMVNYVIDALREVKPDRILTVVGYGGEMVSESVSEHSEIVWQKEQKGTADAVKCAYEALGNEEGTTLICYGDAPLMTEKTLSALLSSHRTNHNDLTILTANFTDPYGYGRIIRESGRIKRIVEQKDCSLEEEAIHEVNTGVYVVDNRYLFDALNRLSLDQGSGEYNLTDVARLFSEEGKKVGAFVIADASEAIGINDRYALSQAEKTLRERINKKWMLSGVTIEDPASTYIGPDVRIGIDTVIRPQTMILGKSVLGRNNIVGPSSYLENAKLGDNNVVEFTHMVDSEVKNGSKLGPYLRIRQNSVVGNDVLLGNFNELKNVKIGDGTFACHLSYLGDADIGRRVNVGAGTIIANYDGVNKFHSTIEDGAFIGSNSTMLSPISVGESSFIAAGSTVNKDVGPHDFAIARARQENKEGYADILREKAEKKAKKQ